MEADGTELHGMIRDATREIADEYDSEYWRTHVDEKEFPEEYWQDLADNGWLGVAIPEEYGGEGMGMLEMAIVIEELSRGGDREGSSSFSRRCSAASASAITALKSRNSTTSRRSRTARCASAWG